MRLIAIALIALAAAPALAATTTADLPAQAPEKSEMGKQKAKMICTREMPVGSLIPVRRCVTQRERDIERENAQRMLDKPIPGNGSN